MINTVYYVKEGQHYLPVRVTDAEMYQTLPVGYHITEVSDCGKITKYNIDPAYAAMAAAGFAAEQAMVTALLNVSDPVPPQFASQHTAWLEFMQEHNIKRISYASASEVAAAGVMAMQQRATELLRNPTVKEAYDTFLATVALASYADDE